MKGWRLGQPDVAPNSWGKLITIVVTIIVTIVVTIIVTIVATIVVTVVVWRAPSAYMPPRLGSQSPGHAAIARTGQNR